MPANDPKLASIFITDEQLNTINAYVKVGDGIRIEQHADDPDEVLIYATPDGSYDRSELICHIDIVGTAPDNITCAPTTPENADMTGEL